MSTGLFWGLLDGLGYSKTPLLRATLLETSEQEMLENDGKDNEKLKKIEKILYLEIFSEFWSKSTIFPSLDLIKWCNYLKTNHIWILKEILIPKISMQWGKIKHAMGNLFLKHNQHVIGKTKSLGVKDGWGNSSPCLIFHW